MELNSIQQLKLEKLNNGFNFGNMDKPKERKYFVEVLLKTTINLKGKVEEVEVKHNLFSNYSYGDEDVIDFFEKLEEFAKKPLVKIRYFNRKSQVSTWGFSDKFRNKTIKFLDIEISIGELAEQKLKKMDIDFKEKIKELLDLQKKDDKAQKFVDRYVFLKEKMLTLDECVGKKKESYSYGKKADETLKIVLLTPEQYNEKLKEIETEMREIAEKFGISISEYDFKYIAIPKKVGFDEWLKASKSWLKENWEEFDDDEKNGRTFKKYTEDVYDECNGEIVEQGGYPDGYGMDYDEDEDEEDEDEEE